MTRLVDTLSRYVGSKANLGRGKVGEKDRQILETRAQFVLQLQRDVKDARSTLLLWGVITSLTFVFLLVSAIVKTAYPYITVPAGCVGFFAVGRRVESVWRELHLQSLALQMALIAEDDTLTRDVMVTLNAALLAQQTKAKMTTAEKTETDIKAA